MYKLSYSSKNYNKILTLKTAIALVQKDAQLLVRKVGSRCTLCKISKQPRYRCKPLDFVKIIVSTKKFYRREKIQDISS